MRRRKRLGAIGCAFSLGMAATILPNSEASAQRLPSVVDSIGVDVMSRYVWRGLDLGKGLTMRSSVSFGLWGFSRSADGDNNLTLDVENWLPIARRSSRRVYDQSRIALRFGHCIAACKRISWSKRAVLDLSAAEYYRPNVSDRWSPELTASLTGEWQVPRLNGQFGGLFYPYVFAAVDPTEGRSTYTSAGISTQTPTVMGLAAALGVNVAMSNYPRTDDDEGFGFHSWGGGVSVLREQPLKAFRTMQFRLHVDATRLRAALGESSVQFGLAVKIY